MLNHTWQEVYNRAKAVVNPKKSAIIFVRAVSAPPLFQKAEIFIQVFVLIRIVRLVCAPNAMQFQP